MGVYIGLDIITNRIDALKWEAVYKETLQLLQAYPFADLITEDVDGLQRVVLDKAKEQYENDHGETIRYWKTCGDLDTKEMGETFQLYGNINRYIPVPTAMLMDDIVMTYAAENEQGYRTVFYAKTQGKDYHMYILGISMLIESRFPEEACVFGNITKQQAQKAENWVNSILDKPVSLPVRIDYESLFQRLQKIEDETERLQAFYNLAISDDKGELDTFVKKHLGEKVLIMYLTNELSSYNSPTQLGAKMILIRLLNIGVSIETLCNIFCINSDGPKYEPSEFVNALCSTWVFVPLEKRSCMDIFKRPSDLPHTVESDFGTMFLDIYFTGRHTTRYIPFQTVSSLLISKFDIQGQQEFLSKQYEEIYDVLAAKEEELNKIQMEYNQKIDGCIITEYEELIHWDKDAVVSESLRTAIETLSERKRAVMKVMKDIITQIVGESNDRARYIKLIVGMTQETNIVLTKAAWNWIEAENVDVLQTLLCLLSTSKNSEVSSEVRKVYRAMMENRDLFYEFMFNKK